MKKSKKMVISIILFLCQICFLNFVSAEDRKIKSYTELKYLNIDKQMAEFTCGVAVLTTLFNFYYGLPITEEKIIEEFLKKMMEEKKGITFLDMKKICANKGFETVGYKMNYAGLLKILKEMSLPLIVHLESDFTGKEVKHFTLLTGVVDDWLILNDTSIGKRVVSKDEFLPLWTGYVMVVNPGSKGLAEKIYEKLEKQKGEVVKYVSKVDFYQDCISNHRFSF